MKLNANQNLNNYLIKKVLFVRIATPKMNTGGLKVKNSMNVKNVALE